VLSSAMMLVTALLAALTTGWRWSRRDAMVGAWLVLFFTPTILLVLVTGNVTALVALSYALGILLLQRGRDSAAGAVLAIGLIKPQLAFLVLPLLLYKRRWRSCAAYCATVAVAVAITLPFVGIGAYRDFLTAEHTMAGRTQSTLVVQDAPGIHALLLQAWPHSGGAEAASYPLYCLIIAAVAWFWRGEWRPRSQEFIAGWSMLIATTLLVSPYAHSYDLVLLIIVMVTLYRQWSHGSACRWRACIVLSLAFVAPPYMLATRQHVFVPILLAAIWLLWAGARASPRRLEVPQGQRSG
jgi:arabinofuranan 3-O-arabinosyltransferase